MVAGGKLSDGDAQSPLWCESSRNYASADHHTSDVIADCHL